MKIHLNDRLHINFLKIIVSLKQIPKIGFPVSRKFKIISNKFFEFKYFIDDPADPTPGIISLSEFLYHWPLL